MSWIDLSGEVAVVTGAGAGIGRGIALGLADVGATLVLLDREDASSTLDEIASREGAFSLARGLRDAVEPFSGVIVILLERKHDVWLARWSGADAWFVRPVDPFELADRVMELITEKESA